MMRLALFAGLFILTPSLYAAQVLKVKGKNVLIDLNGEAAANGDQYFALSADGKRVALVLVNKIKGEKAIGKVIKGGNVTAGMTLEMRPSKKAGHPTSTAKASSGDSSSGQRAYWGAIFGFGLDSMKVNVSTSNATADMSGTGFSGKLLFDYELLPQVWFRGAGGVESFNASGGNVCGPTAAAREACDAKIMYIDVDFLGRYVFSQGSFRPWLGAGVALLFPASKSSTALASNSIGTTNVLLVSGGFDWFTSPTFYVPFAVEYGMFPKSDEVDASWIAFRLGFAIPF